jgi:hypothetical protein
MFKSENVGGIDRLLRLLVGAALIAAPYFVQSQIWANSLFRIGLPIVGAILVLTALFRFCPAYKLTGWNTSKVE